MPNPVTPTYRKIVSGDHSALTVANVLADWSTPLVSNLPIIDGQLQGDRTAQIRRSLSATVVDYDGRLGRLVPDVPSDPLAPYGPVLQVSRRVWSHAYPAGESVQLGIMSISNAHAQADGTIQLQASDLSRRCSRAKLTGPYVVAAGENYADAIVALVSDRLGNWYRPGAIATTDENTPLLTYDTEDDPWQTVIAMATAIGMEAYFDSSGAFCLQPPQQVEDDTVSTTLADDGGILLDADRELADDPGYNGVLMRSEASTLDEPLSTLLWDTNPSSPTYYLGPYGMAPAFQSSPYIGTQDQCDAAAAKWLMDNLGGTEQVSATMVPDGSVLDGDIARLNTSRVRASGLFMVDSFSLPFKPTDAMQVTMRARRAISGAQVDESGSS